MPVYLPSDHPVADANLFYQLTGRLHKAKRKANGSYDCVCPFCGAAHKNEVKANLHPKYGFSCFHESCESKELGNWKAAYAIAPDLIADYRRECAAERRGALAHVVPPVAPLPPPARDESLLTSEEAFEFVGTLPRCGDLPAQLRHALPGRRRQYSRTIRNVGAFEREHHFAVRS
jgi:hypothetical protein